MVSEKTNRRKGGTAAEPSESKGASSKGGGGKGESKSWLRTWTDPRSERRYEPKTSALAIVSVVAMSIGAVLVGAGTYGQWFRAGDAGPHPAAPWLLASGAMVLLGVALCGQWSSKPIRVGDAGVAIERAPGEIERIEWYEVKSILLSPEALTIQGSGTAISVPLGLHRQAAARIVAEAKRRLPNKSEDLDAAKLGAVEDGEEEKVELEPPQVAGLHCKSTDKIIAFEKDARLCGRCGEVYHKDGVPKRCATCDAPLKA